MCELWRGFCGTEQGASPHTDPAGPRVWQTEHLEQRGSFLAFTAGGWSKEGWYMGSRPCSKPGVYADTEDCPEQWAKGKEPARACDSRGVQVALVTSKPWRWCWRTCLWGPNASCPFPTWLCCRPVCPANPTLSEPSDSVFYPITLREARRNFLK